MPGFDSFGKVVAKGDKLLATVTANADRLQPAEALRAQLEEALARFKELGVRRDNLNAEKQVLSQQLLDQAHRINDLVIDLKTMVKATLGTKNEKLVEFSIPPRRQVVRTNRSRTSKASKARKAAASQAPPETNPPAA